MTPPLEVLSAEMQAKYERLTAVWNKAEEQLKRLHIPLFTYVTFTKAGEDGTHYLAWCVYGRDWRLCHGFQPAGIGGTDYPDFRPLAECTLVVRIAASQGDTYSKLRNALIAKAPHFALEVDQAANQLEQLLQ